MRLVRYSRNLLVRVNTVTVFSFHPVKIVTTAEGGAALTNDKVLADKWLFIEVMVSAR